MNAELSKLLGELKQDYLIALPVKIRKIEELHLAGLVPALREEFHKLKGTGKTYGFPEITILCEAVEKLCETHQEDLVWVIPTALKCLRKIHTNHQSDSKSKVDEDPDFMRIRSRVTTL